MTNLKKRMDNILSEFAIIQDMLSKSVGHPPCCLTFYKNGEIRCEVIGPLPENEFLRECRKCRAEIRSFVERVGIEKSRSR